MTIVTDTVLPPCADDPSVFLDDCLQSPQPRHALNAAARRDLEAKKAAARRRCAGCHEFVECLFRAVVRVNVSGYVACTTEADRLAIRRELGVDVTETEVTDFGAPRVGGGPVSHEAVMAARAAHPRDTCHQLAQRLGCSTSTVKRHLRRARQELGQTATASTRRTVRPTVDQVLDAFDALETPRVA